MRAAGLEQDVEVQQGPNAAEQAREQAGQTGPALDGGRPGPVLDGRPLPFDPRMLLGLQAAAGNAAVSGLIAESRASPASPMPTAGPPPSAAPDPSAAASSAREVGAAPLGSESEAPAVDTGQGAGTADAGPAGAGSAGTAPADAGPAEEDLAMLDANADAAQADHRDAESLPAGPSTSDDFQGGGGGGGAAIEEPAPVPTPALAGLEPGQALASAAALPPGRFLDAIGGVAQSVDHATAGEHERLVREPPSRVRHPGSPGTVEAPAARRIVIASDPAASAVTQVRDGADVAVMAPTPLAAAPPAATTLAPEPIIAGTGDGELSPRDTQQIATSIARLPTTDRGLHIAPGPRPHLPLEGSADPVQVHRQQAHLERALADEHARGRLDAARDYGEGTIYPTAPAETLVARVDGVQGPADGAPAAGAEPDEAVSVIAQQEKGASVQAAASAGVGELAQQRRAYAEKTLEARAGSEQEIAAHERANIAEQAGERNAAQQDVRGLRSRWTQEQHELVDRAKDESTTTARGAIDAVDTARAKADDEAAAHYRDGQAQAAAAQREAEAHALAERQRAQQQGSGGFFGMLASAARSVFDAAKQAVQGVFDRARQLVRGAIERAQQLALAAMERAKQTIVGAIHLAGDALTAIGDRVLVAFPAIRDRFRGAIQERIASAEAAVNRISNALKIAVQSRLDLLGRALSAAVAGLRRGMQAIVDNVRQVARSAVDFARNAIAGLGTFAVLVRDVAANPGRWLGNLAAAAQDGIRNHLWPDLKLAVQSWFTDKVDSVLGLGAAAWRLLKKGGVTVMQVAGVAWEGLKAMIPQTIIWVLIEKLVALIVPAAAAVMLIIQALQAAWGSIGRIIQAFDAFMAFLKGVRWGSAGPLFGKAVAAGAVAVIEFISQFLLQRLMGAAGKIAGKIRSLAQRIGARLAGVSRGIGKGAKWLGKKLGQAGRATTGYFERGRNIIRRSSERLHPKSLATERIRPGHEFAGARRFTVVESDGTVAIRRGPINPGPLEPAVGATFRSASYTERKLGAPVDLYRSYSNPARRLGPYWTRSEPSGPLQSKIDSAILKEFNNEATLAAHIRVPPGETIFEGAAARQLSKHEDLLGGGSQAFLLRIDPSWEVKE